jgi:serpin B
MRFLLSGLTALALLWSLPMTLLAQKVDPDVATLVRGNNEFALDLYQQIAAEKGNLFFSPYSISNALAMTYSGARGNTAAEMKRTLHFTLADDRLPSVFGKLIGQLDAGGEKRSFQLSVANRLWGQKDYGFQPEFLKISKDFYRAGLEELDFRATEEARKTINAWVEKQTQNKIKDLIPAGVLKDDTRLVLTNAIYFKAPWLTPFNPKETKPAPFLAEGGKMIQTAMMHAKHQRLSFAALDSFDMLEMPYEGYGQSMILLLPKKNDGLGALEKQLNAAALTKWKQKLSTHMVDVTMPKFKVTAEITLNGVLMKMGMNDAFKDSKADFSGMATREKLYISAALHKAFVDVNEAGTEAAASTALVMSPTSAPPPATFRADHPFIYLIRDNATGSILFAGRLADPQS